MKALYHHLTERQLAAIGPGSSSYMFVGPVGSGRRLATTLLAQRLNCSATGDDNCNICQNLNAGSFADLHVVTGTPGVGIEQIQTVQQALAQRPFSAATTRVVVIEADALTVAAQNRLLKTLEEPPAQTIIVLISEQTASLLPTIQSRCQIIHFVNLPTSVIAKYLETMAGDAEAHNIMQLDPVSIGQAISLFNDLEMRTTIEASIALAKRFVAASLFERLVLAQSQKAKVSVVALLNSLAGLAKNRVLPPQAFVAIEKAFAALNANVGPRTVMEALALAL